jgi:plasmid stabilization system protein ParE
MSYELIIRPEAEAELSETYNWYENRAPGLGSEFLLAVDALLNSIARNPQQYPIVHKTIRRALTRRFPYQVFFVLEEKRVVVVAVFHARRNPRRWQERQ